MIEILTENLGAGELKTFMLQGEYVELLEAQYPLDVFMMDRNGGQISAMRKAEASFFSRPGRFEVIQLQSANAQQIRLFVGSGDAGTRRTSGVVSVVDGEKSRTLAGGMLSASIQANAVAGQNSVAQLFNPANSGKNLVILAAALTSPSQVGLYFMTGAAALGADVTVNTAANKKAGAGLGAAQCRTGSAVAIPALNANLLWSLNVPAFGYQPWPIKGAIVIPPGKSLDCWGSVANTQVQVNLEWFEEAV